MSHFSVINFLIFAKLAKLAKLFDSIFFVIFQDISYGLYLILFRGLVWGD